jgi:7-carboxy-7-deazaguanine synthase
MYTVKEIFLTLQGEGINAGRVAVFCRFSGCNLWSGRESDRHSSVCKFCDTDFVSVGPDGGKFQTAEELVEAVVEQWPKFHSMENGRPLVVCTGGEPLLQLDEKAINEFHRRGFQVAVETNGTVEAPRGIDHVCVSPKAGSLLKILAGTELKLVYPQIEAAAQPECFEQLAFDHFYLQPMDGVQALENTQSAIRYCLDHPKWRLSLQTHKMAGIR